MAFDRRAGRIVLLALASSYATPTSNASRTWTFDVCTNTWQLMQPDQEPPGGASSLAYDADSDRTVALVSSEARLETWIYDLAANHWSRGTDAPLDADGLIYDPVSGLLVTRVGSGDGNAGVWAYEVETDTWTKVRQENLLAAAGGFRAFGYDASIDRLVGWNAALGTWLFDPRAGTWTPVRTGDPAFSPTCYAPCGTSVGFDEATGMAEFVSGLGDRVIGYDAKAQSWTGTVVGSLPYTACLANDAVYDALSRRIVCVSGYDDGKATGVSAFDSRTRQWISLLDPVPPASSTASPAPSP